MTDQIEVEVIYAGSKIFTQKLFLTKGSTISDAIHKSDVLQECPEIDLKINKVGIHAIKKSLDDIVEEDDRIEIYRPLKVDPMEARRRRASK